MRLDNVYRQKLLNAILYFSDNIQKPNVVNILKLLYYLDFQHFRETGRSVTNLDYYAYKFGPVPRDFYENDGIRYQKVPDDFADRLALIPFSDPDTEEVRGARFKPRQKSDLSIFSPRELKIMGEIAEIYKEVDAATISEISHLKNEPWDKTQKTKGKMAKIDYDLALDKDAKVSIEDALDQTRERSEMLRTFPLLEKLS